MKKKPTKIKENEDSNFQDQILGKLLYIYLAVYRHTYLYMCVCVHSYLYVW